MTIYLILIIILLLIINIYQFINYSLKDNITKNSSLIVKNNSLEDNILTINASNLDKRLFLHIFNFCIISGIPLKIKNGIKYFPKIKDKWNIDYIKKKYKNNNDIVSFQTCQGVDLNINNVNKLARPYIKKYIEKYKSEKKKHKNTTIVDGITSLYLDSNYLNHTNHNPQTYLFRREKIESESQNRILDDVIPNIMFSKKDIRSYIIYNGPKNTGILPHDHKHSLNILKTGKKQWIFCNNYTPETSPNNIIKNLISNNNTIKTTNDINDLNDLKNDKIKWIDWYNTYKKYNKNNQIECTQEAGDLIYVPNQIFHAVYNLENTCGLVIDLQQYGHIDNQDIIQLN